MIAQFQLTLRLPNNIKTNNIGTVLHGVLMELLPGELVEMLHQQSSYNPLKQRIIMKRDESIWEIVSFHPEITDVLLDTLPKLTSLHLKYHDVKVPIIHAGQRMYKLQETFDTYFNDEEPKRYVTLDILTPMSFKSRGRHNVLPDVRRIFRSAMIQYDGFFDRYKMHDHETLEFIEEKVHIVDYRLRTTRFHLEGSRIPAFVGRLTLQLNGPTHFKQLLHFLLFFGSLSGVGVKTTLGMGKYTV